MLGIFVLAIVAVIGLAWATDTGILIQQEQKRCVYWAFFEIIDHERPSFYPYTDWPRCPRFRDLSKASWPGREGR
jgi:hypothetical protein